MSQNASTSDRSVATLDKRKALNPNTTNNSNTKYVSAKRIRTEDFDPKMSENAIAVNNAPTNRFAMAPNGVSKGSQLVNASKPGTAKKLIIKNFG